MRRPSANSILVVCVSAAILAAVISGAVLLDSPAEARLRRFDERRVDDLRELSYAVDAFWTREGRLPDSLDELGKEERIVWELADPETGEPYEYRALGETTFELCAEFASDAGFDEHDAPFERFWLHGAGKHCFELEAQDIDRMDAW